MDIITLEEAREQNRATYFTGKPCSRGHIDLRFTSSRSCASCAKIARSKWEASNKEEMLRKAAANSRTYRKKNKEKVNIARRRWAAENREKDNAYSAKWRRNNKPRILALTRKRQAAQLQRTPAWLDAIDHAEMEFTYIWCNALRSCGLDYHVDHIVPLQGKMVSGFHVPSNLQVIPASENIKKGNKLEVRHA